MIMHLLCTVRRLLESPRHPRGDFHLLNENVNNTERNRVAYSIGEEGHWDF